MNAHLDIPQNYDPNFSPRNGKYVQVGTDQNGDPLYQSIEAATDPLSNLSDDVASKVCRPAGSGRRSNVKAVGYDFRPGLDSGS